MTKEDLPVDPRGLNLDLDDLTQAWNESSKSQDPAARILIAFGQCKVFGVEVEERHRGFITEEFLGLAADGLRDVVERQIGFVTGLGDRWYDLNAPEEADNICIKTLRRRTDLWGGVQVLMQHMPVPIELAAQIKRLADTIRDERYTIATIADTTEFLNLRHDVSGASSGALPWWIGDELDLAFRHTEQLSESSANFAILAEAQRHRDQLPSELMLGMVALTQSASDENEKDYRVLRWVCEEEPELFARMRVPVESSAADEAKKRPLVFCRANPDGSNPRCHDFNGLAARLGDCVDQIGDKAEVRFSLSEIRESFDGYLWVGESPCPWVLASEEE